MKQRKPLVQQNPRDQSPFASARMALQRTPHRSASGKGCDSLSGKPGLRSQDHGPSLARAARNSVGCLPSLDRLCRKESPALPRDPRVVIEGAAYELPVSFRQLIERLIEHFQVLEKEVEEMSRGSRHGTGPTRSAAIEALTSRERPYAPACLGARLPDASKPLGLPFPGCREQ